MIPIKDKYEDNLVANYVIPDIVPRIWEVGGNETISDSTVQN